jgi:hypothetical protein
MAPKPRDELGWQENARHARSELPPQERGDEGGPGRASERGLAPRVDRPGRTRRSDGYGSWAKSCLIFLLLPCPLSKFDLLIHLVENFLTFLQIELKLFVVFSPSLALGLYTWTI